LVAHPRKIDKSEIPTLYDIAGSANFYNKTDYGITVHRVKDEETGIMTNTIEVYVQKVKFKHLGNQGVAKFQYNMNNGRFEGRNLNQNWDNEQWIKQNESFDFSDIKDIDF
jgi:twinkle protein